jgi:hypothetical protein
MPDQFLKSVASSTPTKPILIRINPPSAQRVHAPISILRDRNLHKSKVESSTDRYPEFPFHLPGCERIKHPCDLTNHKKLRSVLQAQSSHREPAWSTVNKGECDLSCTLYRVQKGLAADLEFPALLARQPRKLPMTQQTE